jgi:hypothetical protein
MKLPIAECIRAKQSEPLCVFMSAVFTYPAIYDLRFTIYDLPFTTYRCEAAHLG